MSGLDAESLRQLVRDVLREVLPREAGTYAVAAAGPEVRPVRVRDDRDLAALVDQVLDLAADPARAADLRAGRIRFALETPRHTQDPPIDRSPGVPVAPGLRDAHALDVDRGAVTERLVHRAAKEGRALRIGPRAVITPLARDRARALGVSIERAGDASAQSSHQGREPR